jgi:L-seryl-tRNA(Ser) seleniumtransferase
MPRPRSRRATPAAAPGRPPGVERILGVARQGLDRPVDPGALLAAAREVQSSERTRLGKGAPARPAEALADEALARLAALTDAPATAPVAVINATGVIVHTNLGRAAWPRLALEAATRAAAQPVLLELDRETGRRGQRYRAAVEHLLVLTGAEDALVTNNNAAALALAVGLARRRGVPGSGGVVVSRGELVEIGGGVRIPEIVRRSGARLIEVGTTNRTRVADYEEPLASGRAALVLRVHRSNFRQEGFVEEPDPVELAALAHRHGVPLVDDLGSGALLDTAAYGLAHEPMPRERLAAGADLVTFSGDKLVGGPQAGLVAGRADLVAAIRRDPLARAMRPDKVTLAGLTATLALYRSGRAATEVPVWQAIAADPTELRARAERLIRGLAAHSERASVAETRATVGGGALPGETLPSVAIRVRDRSPARLVARLRLGDPCVIARIEDGAVLLDLRTVEPARDEALALALSAAFADPAS